MAAVAGQVRVTAGAGPELDRVGWRLVSSGQLDERTEGLLLPCVVGDGEDLEATVRQTDEQILATAATDEVLDLSRDRLAVRPRSRGGPIRGEPECPRFAPRDP